MNVKRPIYFSLILAILLSACDSQTPTATPNPTPQPGVPRFEEADCPFDVPAGQTAECGYLVIPEDRSRPDGKTIQLAVARFKSDSSEPAPDPIVYLEGGPGGSPLRSFIPQFNVLLAPLLEKRDLILIDQRGTGYSQPALDCPEYKEWSLSVLDEDLSAERAEALGNQVLLECRNRLASTGVDLTAYDSAENAADLNDLRLALDIEQWNLYGISYGTRLALTTMRDFPEGIRSVAIDSVVPLQTNLYTEIPGNGARAFDVFFDTCTADSDCNTAFPDLRRVFFDLVDQLNETPVKFLVKLRSGEKVDALLNGDGLLGLMFQSLYATSIIPLLPRMIYEIRDGNTALIAALQGEFLAQLDDISFGMHYSVQCDEEVPFSTPDELAAATQAYPEYRSISGPGIFDLCRTWGSLPSEPVENQPVASDVPTLVLSGEFDPITPPRWGELAAETLRHSFYFELSGAGHGASLTEECPRSILLAFFDDPATKPEASCIADEMAEVVFAGPVEEFDVQLVSFTEDSMGISGVAPEEWIEVGPGTYTPTGSLTDQSVIVQQARPIQPDAFLDLLTASIEQSGAKTTFEKIDSRTANGLEWSIYNAEASIAAIDVALAESEGVTYIVLLQSVIDERDALYAAVFLPAVDALKPN